MGLSATGILFLVYMGKIIWSADDVYVEGTEAFSVKTNPVCAVCIVIESACATRYHRCDWNECKFSGQEQFIFAVTCIIVSWLWFFGLTIVGGNIEENEDSESGLPIIK